MKKLFLLTCILITINTYSQPLASFEATNKGFGFVIGFQTEEPNEKQRIKIPENIQITAGYHVSFINELNPDIFYGNLGYVFDLQSDYNITTLVGVAHREIKELTNDYNVRKIENTEFIYKIELNKSWHMGRLFLSTNYCKGFYYGIGIKAFLN